MKRLFLPIAAILAGVLLAASPTAPVFAAHSADEPIGYGGAKVRLAPFMAPYRTPSGVRYQVITLQLILDAGLNEKPACFMAPIIHEKFWMYLNSALLQPADLVGQRKEVLEKKLLDIAVATTDRGYYSGVQIVDESSLMVRDAEPSPIGKDGQPEQKKPTTEGSKPLDPTVKMTNADPMALDPKSKTLSSQCK